MRLPYSIDQLECRIANSEFKRGIDSFAICYSQFAHKTPLQSTLHDLAELAAPSLQFRFGAARGSKGAEHLGDVGLFEYKSRIDGPVVAQVV